MQKKTIYLLILLTSLFFLGFWGTAEADGGLPDPLPSYDSLGDVIGAVADFITGLAVVVAPLMIVIGGFLFVTAGGDLEQLSKARQLMLWAAIGLGVVLLSRAIYEGIRFLLGGR